MELPSLLALSLISSSSSSSSSSTTSNTSTANALLKESLCDEPMSASSHTNPITSQHQLDQYCSCMISVYGTCQAGHGSKKRKVVSSDQQGDEVAHVSSFSSMSSLQRKVGHRLNCSDVSTVKDEYQEEEEEELAGYTTPPHLQSSACNAANDRNDCKFENDELPIANNADLDPELSEYEAWTADDHESGRCHYIDGRGGLERTESKSISPYKCGCSCSSTRRGPVPPPPPRKPKATPRILKSSHLNFFVPPDLQLFFSSTSSTSPATSTHDINMKQA